MTTQENFLKLLESHREDEAVALLMRGTCFVGAAGERSAKAALEAARQVCGCDLLSTIYFMNRRHPWLQGQTALERAEQSDEDLEFVIEMIRAVAAGVYI